ncbi:putative DNA-binding domain-containing protein [Sphingobium phenoxybenzoativorans]|uniref:DNA-binding domain-containing protein n=1 Tax=Sphingobium phenoxybenzoativorans TaxID=1592790 RepID=A0A975K669_9SPHN|nr:DNA-binding domain-containing protein [Sphingobium phenoxybenzoativorans]QUT05526.1 putative DNA-binding domain-containing protein [Sphingobium phenoxybenzoativorans]
MSLLAMQRDFRDRLQQESLVVTESFGNSATPGLRVYQNTYRAQLIDCLASTCEQLRAWIGDEAFFAAAATHIDRRPPHAWTLDAYPSSFPSTLTDIHSDSPEIAELAWLEVALADAFVGPDHDPMPPSALADVMWEDAVLLLMPNMRSRGMGTNAPAIWSALATAQEPPNAITLPTPSHVLVWRSGFTSCFRILEADEAAAIDAMAAGQSFATVCNDLVAQHGEKQGVPRAGEMLGRWVKDGLIIGVKDTKPGTTG